VLLTVGEDLSVAENSPKASRRVAGNGREPQAVECGDQLPVTPQIRPSDLVGAENSVTSCDLQILVYQAAEAVSS
jgi:hypothetical protein